MFFDFLTLTGIQLELLNNNVLNVIINNSFKDVARFQMGHSVEDVSTILLILT